MKSASKSRRALACQSLDVAGKTFTLGVIVLLLLLLTAGQGRAQKIVIAWTAVSAFNSPFWVMHEAEFYKQEGLDADMIFIPSSPIAAKATLAGDVAISAQNSQVIADSGLQGATLWRWGRS
jgi:ABC-type nitrate/sulfonate/bicarbonate transport system substrate-binding protein